VLLSPPASPGATHVGDTVLYICIHSWDQRETVCLVLGERDGVWGRTNVWTNTQLHVKVSVNMEDCVMRHSPVLVGTRLVAPHVNMETIVRPPTAASPPMNHVVNNVEPREDCVMDSVSRRRSLVVRPALHLVTTVCIPPPVWSLWRIVRVLPISGAAVCSGMQMDPSLHWILM